jgi:hypothetical protein
VPKWLLQRAGRPRFCDGERHRTVRHDLSQTSAPVQERGRLGLGDDRDRDARGQPALAQPPAVHRQADQSLVLVRRRAEFRVDQAVGEYPRLTLGGAECL